MLRRAPAPRYVRSAWLSVAGLAAVACVGWVPFMGRTLSPDEGGMLVVAAQWAEGSSLYGDYWVDRPPVLIGLFAIADALGGPWALRLMGVLAVVTSVLLAAAVGRLAVPRARRAPLLAAGAAAVLLATPLFGGGAVNGELLGTPFLLAGFAAALRSTAARSTATGLGWGVLAGVAGASAAMVKQNLVDVGVLVVVLAVLRWRAEGRLRGLAAPVLLGFLAGGLAAVAAAVGMAALRGTDPVALWEAVVEFRGAAAATIVSSATDTTTRRLLGLVGAFVGSGAPFLVLALGRAVRRPARDDVPVDLRWPAVAVLAWELVAVYLGGSYWLHYLTGLVPGIVLLAAAAAQRPVLPRRALAWSYGFAAASSLAVVGFVAVHPVERPEEPVIAYLRDRVEPGDTGMVAFGAANILEAVDLHSPYPDLWSLPVRVRDPDLEELAAVLAGSDRPTWLIVTGRSLDTWGIDATLAEGHVEEHYELVGSPGRFTIYHRKDPAP
ncbi:hypothetical protein [Nocardioides dongkuii]|uniref:hypothetical protein n=1 Tax=Nocardioides dongkuii TaxID=2760089 RepID=UPI0015FC036C|nr:hypothetical protein [Nocardioides dongkuii]